MRFQRGYAVVLGVLGSGLLLLLWVHLHSVGRDLRAAHELRTALDTAAYSGAVVQTRTLNALSLLNRSYIGHQIASAHILTLAAWAQWTQNQARQASMANPPSWLIGGFFGSSYGSSYSAAQSVPYLNNLLIRLRGVFDAQQIFNAEYYEAFVQQLESQTRQLRNAVIEEVLAHNLGLKESKDLELEFLEDGWQEVIMHFSAAQGIKWVKELQRHFDFIQQRGRTVRSPTPVSERCPHLRHQLRRIGQTQIDQYGQWSADDSLSFHALRSNRWIGCYYREYAMGWAWQPEQGVSFTGPFSQDARESFGDLHFWRWVDQQSGWGYLSEGVNPLANSYAVRDRLAWQSEPFKHIHYAQRTDYGFILQASIKRKEHSFTAQSAAHSHFAIPSPWGWRHPMNANEHAWFAFWSSSLAEFK